LNKNRLIIAGAIAVSFIFGLAVGDTTATNRANKAVDASVAIKVANVQAKTETATTTPEVAKENNEVSIKVGEEHTSGSWNIKILDAQETTTVKSGNSSDNITTKEKFIVLKLQMKNITEAPVQYAPTEFMLGDMNSKSRYNSNLDALQEMNSNEIIYKSNGEFIGVYDDISPNMPKQTYIVFEVPKSFNIKDGILINENSGADPVGFYIK